MFGGTRELKLQEQQHTNDIGIDFMKRSFVIEKLAERISRVIRTHPVRVGIDGVDGVGKTTLADELLEPLRRGGRSVIRASIDGFHNPRSVRYRLGRNHQLRSRYFVCAPRRLAGYAIFRARRLAPSLGHARQCACELPAGTPGPDE